jgi:hypothetical protein
MDSEEGGDREIDTSEVPGMAAPFFASAILARPRESLIDQVMSSRRGALSGDDEIEVKGEIK